MFSHLSPNINGSYFLGSKKEIYFCKNFSLFWHCLSIVCPGCIMAYVCHLCLLSSNFPSLIGWYCESLLRLHGKPLDDSQWNCVNLSDTESFVNAMTNDMASIKSKGYDENKVSVHLPHYRSASKCLRQ